MAKFPLNDGDRIISVKECTIVAYHKAPFVLALEPSSFSTYPLQRRFSEHNQWLFDFPEKAL